MIHCPNCGTANREGDCVCTACGEWLADDGPSESPRRADVRNQVHGLRPTEAGKPSAEPPETGNPLAGLRDLMPAAPRIAVPSSYKIPSGAETSQVTRARATLLESLLGPPVQERKPGRRKAETKAARVAERCLVAVVLLATVLTVLLADGPTDEGPRLAQPKASSGITRLYEMVDALDATDSVLVAFDYGPPEADELNPVARPVLEHVLKSGAKISVVTTRADGSPVAAAMMSEIANSSAQYTLLGYRPGAGAAVSHLLAGAEERPTLLLVVTSRPGPLQRWVEQTRTRYGDQLPVVAIGSALLEPVISPYLDASAGQLRAAVHGVTETAAYEDLRGARGEATQRLDALAAGHLAIVALIVVGAAVHGIGGTWWRER